MGQQPTIYGIDIEIDTQAGRPDPNVASIRTVALSGDGFDEVFTGHEATLFELLDTTLASLYPGVLATWNGGTFDLPFLANRARIVGVELGLELRLDRRLTLHRRPLPGHAGAYRCAWGHHLHLDTFRLYGCDAPSSWPALRSIGRLVGLGGGGGPLDRTHDLDNEALHAHAPSDARLARVLAERRWSTAARLVDRLEPAEDLPVDLVDRRARTGQPLRSAAAGF